jgi:hypothetical protein
MSHVTTRAACLTRADIRAHDSCQRCEVPLGRLCYHRTHLEAATAVLHPAVAVTQTWSTPSGRMTNASCHRLTCTPYYCGTTKVQVEKPAGHQSDTSLICRAKHNACFRGLVLSQYGLAYLPRDVHNTVSHRTRSNTLPPSLQISLNTISITVLPCALHKTLNLIAGLPTTHFLQHGSCNIQDSHSQGCSDYCRRQEDCPTSWQGCQEGQCEERHDQDASIL